MSRRNITHCPKIEGLERRRLLAAAFDASTNTLTVTGTEAADDIAVVLYEDEASVTVNGVNDYESYVIDHLKILALGGGDHVGVVIHGEIISPRTIDVNADLGSGNDTFTAVGGAVTVNGGAGDDTITGSYFRDVLNGGEGNDSLNGSWGIDTVNGNAGTDRASNDALDSLVSIETKIDAKGSGQVTADGTLLVQGTNAADEIFIRGDQTVVIINGTWYPLYDDSEASPAPVFTRIEIRGLGGDDYLEGRETHPPFPSRITFDGGSGNDFFYFEDLTASVIGGSGDDVVTLKYYAGLRGFSDSSGIDTIDAETGVIDLRLYPAVENAIGHYSIIGNDLDNVLHNIAYARGATLSGGKGNDILRSDSWEGLLEGGDGNDLLWGQDDGFLPWEANAGQTLDGGAGVDTLWGSDGGPTTYQNGEVVNPPRPANPVTNDANFRNSTISGSEGADEILIFGLPADSGFVIFNGVPFELPGTGITVLGKGGNDRIEIRANDSWGMRGNFDGGNGNDSLFGGSYNDTLLGGAGDDLLDGRGGPDLMKGGAGSDLVDYSARTAGVAVGIGTLADDGEAGEKDNVYNDIEKVRGGKGNDRLNGSAGPNVLYGGAGNDVLLGNGGADALFGEAGNDSLDGGDANDYLDGGSGNDTLRGGGGIDKFFGWDGNDIFYTRDGNKETVSGGNGTDKAQRDAFDVLFSVEATLP
ncbi:MAG: hypothetical protein QOE14_1369 [Humisphaera sp.]|nr:hypothetical protein [Humisphaera sp.]